jgi:hypothetical protein
LPPLLRVSKSGGKPLFLTCSILSSPVYSKDSSNVSLVPFVAFCG